MSWQERAKCSGQETNTFFDIYEDNPQIRQTVDSICFSCPVKHDCFDEGVATKSWGVWAGVYLVDGQPSKEFNDHKTDDEWFATWSDLMMR